MSTPSSEPLAPFDEPVRRFLIRQGLVPGKGKGSPPPRFDEWAVALSGGGDSVFLLHMLRRHLPPGVRFSLLHFVHHTDFSQNLADRHFVEDLAGRLDIPLLVGESPGSKLSRPEMSETRLRQERHAFFGEFLRQRPKAAIFLGHQADDRIETLLANLFRGGGPRSLIGIARTTGDRIFRPLLPFGREEIRQALTSAGISFMSDPGNDDPRHLRNRIRHRLVPLIDQFFPPHGTRHLSRLASLMEEEIPDRLPRSPALLCEEERRGHIRFSLFLYRSFPPSSQGLFLRELLNRQIREGLPVPEERNLLRSLASRGQEGRTTGYPLGRGWTLDVVFGRVDLVYQYSENRIQKILIPRKTGVSHSLPLERGGFLTVARVPEVGGGERALFPEPGMSCLLPFPDGPPGADPEVTYWTPGLRIRPEEGERKERPVSSLWKSGNFPENRRRTWPVVCLGSYAVWIPGMLDRTASLPRKEGGAECILTYRERERSEWKKFLGNP